MFDANTPTIYSDVSSLTVVAGEIKTSQVQGVSPLKFGVGSGGQRPANGQIYPRGDR